jgi:RNA polymerase sigma-70 factor (ECF subfamily)
VSSENAPERFPTTSWTFIHTGKELPPEDYVTALDGFIARYWRPVFSFMRCAGHQVDDAADLTQEFLIRVVERGLVHKADETRGRFRTFLLWHAKMFLADQGSNRAPRQRTFERQLIPVSSLLGDEDRSFEPAAGESAEAIFNRKWAADLVQRVLDRIERFYQKERRASWFEIFAAAHFPRGTAATQEALGQRFGMSRDQVRYAQEKVEQRFAHYLREEVQHEIGADADLDDEVRELLALLGR